MQLAQPPVCTFGKITEARETDPGRGPQGPTSEVAIPAMRREDHGGSTTDVIGENEVMAAQLFPPGPRHVHQRIVVREAASQRIQSLTLKILRTTGEANESSDEGWLLLGPLVLIGGSEALADLVEHHHVAEGAEPGR